MDYKGITKIGDLVFLIVGFLIAALGFLHIYHYMDSKWYRALGKWYLIYGCYELVLGLIVICCHFEIKRIHKLFGILQLVFGKGLYCFFIAGFLMYDTIKIKHVPENLPFYTSVGLGLFYSIVGLIFYKGELGVFFSM